MFAKSILAVVLSLAALACHAGTVTVNTYGPRLAGGPNHGWWSDEVANYDGNDNFATGFNSVYNSRGFFSFDLSELEITSLTGAVLELPQGLMTGPVDLFLWDVTSDPAAVNANSGINAAIYADLGSGTEYGRLHIDLIGQTSLVSVELNAAGLAALEATEGFFTIGASAPGEYLIFGNSEGMRPQLVLQGEVRVIPEPPVAGMLTAGLVLLAVAGTWRKAEPSPLFDNDGT